MPVSVYELTSPVLVSTIPVFVEPVFSPIVPLLVVPVYAKALSDVVGTTSGVFTPLVSLFVDHD